MNTQDLAHTHAAAFANSRGWTAAEFEKLLAQETSVMAGDTTSFVLGRMIVDEVEILTIATAPAAQRKGKARAALADFLAQITARQANMVFLEVAEDNDAAIGFYKSAGFTQVAVRKGYYRRANGAAFDAIVMQLSIPQR